MREILKLVVVLGLICAASGLALSFVYDVTKEPIYMTKLQKVKAPAVMKVLQGFDNDPMKDLIKIPVGKDKKGKPLDLLVFPAKKAGKTFAVAYETSATGYHGEIAVMVGVDLAKKDITGIQIVEQSETPGLGARILNPEFTDSFKGKPVDKELTKGDINALSGATLSTNGVVAAVNKARVLYEKYGAEMAK
ncbi:RnfABCDGE type electron transport complex subunit G [Dethiosulfatarculus sandiegensis]|uniref:RnfABCDGE type electron transport complex subunit G n=1 Tax=Dethiosulfatarculus sandiegensis TaxID=1429043 RepID=UPI0005C9F148|nr:RnfABCDGE type electron transport complex subunit G [Dethiosulfatarculus sandiegensis]